MILTRSAPLRMLTLLLFYFTQGFPIGVFFFAIPGWMAANGAETREVAAVVSAAALPWSLKLVNGFILDRYTFLPMGRRRVWIIGAQCIITLVFLGAALIAPASGDTAMLAAIGFAANMAVTVQDVGIDSLAVDIMPENERAKAGGIMFGAQMLGISAATSMTGLLVSGYGISAAMVGAAIVPATIAVYGMMIREREGERRFPWSKGAAQQRNLDIQVEAWWPLLKSAFKAIILPGSLVLIPISLLKAMPDGAMETLTPIMATQMGGWELSAFTGMSSVAQLIAGLVGLTLGGWLIDWAGAQRSLIVLWIISICAYLAIGAGVKYWDQSWFVTGYVVFANMMTTFIAIALIPISMRMCSPSVAATQFTIYMAISNFGRPIGATLTAATSDYQPMLYWVMAGVWVGGLVLLLSYKFPTKDQIGDQSYAGPMEGEGLVPAID